MYRSLRVTGRIALILGLLLGFMPAIQAQTAIQMEALREQVQSDKKQLIAANLDLTSAQADAFWPLYDELQIEIEVINSRIGWLIRDFGAAYAAGNISDEGAKTMLEEALAIEEDDTAMRKKYAKRMRKVIPPTELVRYLQIENKIRAAIRFDLARNIALFE